MENIKWYEVYWDESSTWYTDDDGNEYEDWSMFPYLDEYPNDGEEVYIKFENGEIKTVIYDGCYDFGEYDLYDDIVAWGRKEEE